MGLGDDIKEFENDATGQGGNDGDNNANRANGGTDKTEDTLADSGMSLQTYVVGHAYLLCKSYADLISNSHRPICQQGGRARWIGPRDQQSRQR